MTNNPTTTIDATAQGASRAVSEPAVVWTVTVVGAPRPDVIGRQCVLERGEVVVLGRDAEVFGPDALADRRLSRRHVSLELGAAGVQVVDLGSHNGTQIDGHATTTATVGPGAVLVLGRTVVMVHCRPAIVPVARDLQWLGCGQVHAVLGDVIDRVATRATTLLVVGPPGAGKTAFAQAVARASGRPGPVMSLHCGRVSDPRAQVVFGDGTPALPATGTVILEGLDAASPVVLGLLVRWLDTPPTDRARLIATADPSVLTRPLPSDLSDRVARFVVQIPPLTSHLEDVAMLAGMFVERYLGQARALHPRLVLQLLRHPWPGNVRELEAAIECLCIDADDRGEFLRVTPRVQALLQAGDAQAEAPRSDPAQASDVWRVASDGRWFCPPGQAPVDLSRRAPLARMLAALVHERQATAGRALGLMRLVGAGWPEERVMERAAANRVHVALATLRRLGLRDLLRRSDDGYLLDPAAVVRSDDAPA